MTTTLVVLHKCDTRHEHLCCLLTETSKYSWFNVLSQMNYGTRLLMRPILLQSYVNKIMFPHVGRINWYATKQLQILINELVVKGM